MNPLQVDVRAILASGASPCDAIDEAVARLSPGQELVLIAPFQPIPLYTKLGREGFAYREESRADGTWRIVFQRTSSKPAAGASRELVELDNRGLAPPEPFTRTLEALGTIPPGGKLLMRCDRKPSHLFAELEARGFAFDCTEQPDHSFLTEIWPASAD